MADIDVPLAGTTLIVGPSNAGKTRATAHALDAWLADHGPAGVAVLDFAPVVERDGTVLGGRLTQFTSVPDGAWHGVLDAYAPRTAADADAGALKFAAVNAANARRLVAAAPADPAAVFVNDATIPFQADTLDVDVLTGYCDRAAVAVLNAFESDDLGVDDPVSVNERAARDDLRAWADRVVDLG